MQDRDKIKTKIFKLLQKTCSNGCSEQEAMAAAEMAGKLMDQYNINITDIEIRQSGCIKKVVELDNAKSGCIGRMAVAIAKYCDVKVWAQPGARDEDGKVEFKCRLTFFGLETDVQMASYLLEIVRNALARSVKEFHVSKWFIDYIEGQRRGVGRSATVGFKNGFANRICTRIDELKDERQEAEEERLNEYEETLGAERRERTSRCLVDVKMAHIEDELKKTGMILSGGGRSANGGDWSSKEQGRHAANSVGLSAGVSGQSTTLAIGC